MEDFSLGVEPSNEYDPNNLVKIPSIATNWSKLKEVSTHAQFSAVWIVCKNGIANWLLVFDNRFEDIIKCKVNILLQ